MAWKCRAASDGGGVRLLPAYVDLAEVDGGDVIRF